jgi:hypothetical protein
MKSRLYCLKALGVLCALVVMLKVQLRDQDLNMNVINIYWYLMLVLDVINRVKDPSRHEHIEHQTDVEYQMAHLMGTMKTPYIAVMDGITSKITD